jgi:hypothetical protein
MATRVTTATRRRGATATGADIVTIAAAHLNERYVLGAAVPKNNAEWKGPWDCAEFASWCVFQASGKLFGCDQDDNPNIADAFSGFWRRDAERAKCTVPLARAKSTAGAFLLRFPQPQLIGHVAVSDGKGGTIEAHSSKTGVIRNVVDGRRWDVGVLPPMIRYEAVAARLPVTPPGLVFRLKKPTMKDPLVKKLQDKLSALGFSPGPSDGDYGPHTAAAVLAFQLEQGLVADGEAGPKTFAALGIA